MVWQPHQQSCIIASMRVKYLTIATFFYTLFTFVLFRPLLFHLGTAVYNAGDPLFYAWNLAHNWYAFTHGLATLLNTNIYFPTTNTLAFADTLITQTILTAPILMLTNNPLLAEHLYLLATFPLAAVGMMLLAYRFTKQSLPSFAAGTFFAFSLVRVALVSHVALASSFLLPYILLALFEYIEEGKQRTLLLLVLLMLATAGASVYVFLFALMACMGILLFFCISPPIPRKLLFTRLIKAIPLGFLFCIGTLVLFYPYILLKVEHPEIKRSIEEAAVFAAYQEDYTAVATGSIALKTLLPVHNTERALFPTFTLLLLGLYSIRFIKKWKKEEIALVLMGLVAFILSFGPTRPFHIGPWDTGYLTLPYKYVYKLFPLLQIIRVPARFSILVAVALAAMGGATLARMKKSTWVLAVCLTIFLIEIWQSPLALVSVPSYASVPAVYQWVKNTPVRVIAELPLDNIESGKNPIPLQVAKQYTLLTIDDPLALETYRVYFAGYHGKQTVNGYSGFIPDSYHEAVDAFRAFPADETLAFAKRRGISHIIVHLWQYPPDGQNKLKEAIAKQSGLQLVAQFNDDYVYQVQ